MRFWLISIILHMVHVTESQSMRMHHWLNVCIIVALKIISWGNHSWTLRKQFPVLNQTSEKFDPTVCKCMIWPQLDWLGARNNNNVWVTPMVGCYFQKDHTMFWFLDKLSRLTGIERSMQWGLRLKAAGSNSSAAGQLLHSATVYCPRFPSWNLYAVSFH